MDGLQAEPQPTPRLRLSRQPMAAVSDRPVSEEESQAGPSRPRVLDFGDEDLRPTPKAHPNSNASPPGEAAARLRALVSLTSKTPTSAARPVSPSEVDSDFDPPRFTPSVARESLKDLFFRASRDPGDTPIKNRRRRNSIDTSEVEASPRVQERAKNKGKRKSLSDEEADKTSRSFQRSETSLRSSQAATFDNLRERLTNSHTLLRNQVAPTMLDDDSSADDSAAFLRDLNASQATPPVATSTPLHSMEISGDSRYQTNLLERDSEMQHMMRGLDSYEGDSGSSQPISFPPVRSKTAVRPGSSSSSHRLSHNGMRPVSQGSTNFGDESHHDQQDVLHEREREWNKHHAKGKPPLEKSHSHSHSHDHHFNSRSNSPTVTVNGHSRTRTHSGGSVHSVSVEDGTSSKGTSRSSQSDYKERIRELEKERNAEKEHGWNRRQGARSTSALSAHSPLERSRKLSHPLRPGSSLSTHSPEISHRHSGSFSRTDSDDGAEAVRHEIEHERERNWGAPIPRWHQHPLPGHRHSHSRSTSPLSPSPSTSTSSHNPHSSPRFRAESLRTGDTPKGESPIHRDDFSRPTAASLVKGHAPAKTPLHSQTRPKILSGPGSRPRPISYPARPNSPLPPPLDPKSERPRPVKRTHSRVLSSPSPSPGSRPTSRASLIPVRSPVKSQIKSSRVINGHRNIPSQSHSSDPFLQPQITLSEPGSPESTTDEGQRENPPIETDEEDILPEDRTPTLENIPIPSTAQTAPQPIAPSDDEELFQKALTVAPPPSPPPSPPTPIAAPSTVPTEPEGPRTTILGLLSTPPKRPSFHTSRLEFQTPSPPHGLPELPGPPSSDEEETETERLATTPLRFNATPDTTSMKTPRPPGAWMATPAPVPRAQSLPAPAADDSDSQHENGLATPVPSLSRASSLPTQTPKPPGGWVATPTPRKSILKVRFDPQPSELELSAAEDVSSVQELSSPAGSLPTPVEETPRPHTPELPTKPASPVKSPRRSPIRIVDEYGRPDKSTAVKSPKSRKMKPIRIVDAMGREVQSVESNDEPYTLDHNEAVRVVRQSVNDLVQGLDEMDLSGESVLLDQDRLQELDNTSRAAREARDGLKQAYLNDKSAQLRGNMQRSKSESESRHIYPPSRLPRVWLWTFIIIIFQAIFIFLLYRAQKTSARELFLKTYYDPFYPNLHLYESHDYLTFTRTSPSLASLLQTLREDGFKAFAGSLIDAITVLLVDWRQDAWRRWGTDDMRPRWPPT